MIAWLLNPNKRTPFKFICLLPGNYLAVDTSLRIRAAKLGHLQDIIALSDF